MMIELSETRPLQILLFSKDEHLRAVVEVCATRLGALLEMIAVGVAILDKLIQRHYDCILLESTAASTALWKQLNADKTVSPLVVLSHEQESNEILRWMRLGEQLPNKQTCMNAMDPMKGWLRLEELEKTAYQTALMRSQHNKSQAALLLGISRRTLERKLKRWEAEDVA
jgi:DNA-binding NtrC family response regulator